MNLVSPILAEIGNEVSNRTKGPYPPPARPVLRRYQTIATSINTSQRHQTNWETTILPWLAQNTVAATRVNSILKKGSVRTL